MFEWFSMFLTSEASNAATCAIALAAIVGVIFSIRQLRAMRRARDMDFSVRVMQEFRSPEWVSIYRELYLAPRDAGKLERHPSIQHFERVLDRLEWIGIMKAKHSISEEVAVRLIGGLPLRVWYILSEYVERRRHKRGHYARYAEYFTKRSLMFQIVYQPYKEWTKLNVRGETIELVPELLKMKILSGKELKYAKFRRRLRLSLRVIVMWNWDLRMGKKEWAKLQMPRGLTTRSSWFSG